MTKGKLAGHLDTRRARTRTVLLLVTIFAAVSALVATPAMAAPPFDGTPVSAGLGPTYSDPWCAPPAPGTSIANQQGAPLALIPYEAIGCTLAKFQNEATAASLPHRMDYSIIGTSSGGRDMYGVVVNALETMAQQRDYARWQQLRALELTDPTAAQILLNSWGGDVKMPVFIENNIHGNEEEGADALMQVLRDLVTTPYGVNPTVDKILDHTILIVIPSQNPDGRFAGTRANDNGFDMNRDFIVQSQAETRISIKLQHEWLATVGLATHGYVNPTLIDGLTKPHNPGLEYDLFAYWNQRRLDANQTALAAVGLGITRPVNMWNAGGGGTTGNPAIAEGWDDWGPFYTQTYMAYLGSDSSTLEMCSGGTGCNGRFGSKLAQYIGFYSSADYWIDNRQGLMRDQVEVFRRGVADADRPACCSDPLLALRGFTELEHNWMIPYPKAYVIPFSGGGQRSDGEANRMAKWLLDNGILVRRMTSDFTWGSTTYPAGSYVVYMNQALRGLALTVLSAGQDISTRITQLYAPPGAWSHGLMWGADVVEIPRGDGTFSPSTAPIGAPNALDGGIRGGTAAASDFYSVTLQGPTEVRAALALLRSGVTGEIAEASFTSTTGGLMSAGTLIFPNDAATKAAIHASGLTNGMTYERNVGVTKPATTKIAEAPKIGILVNSANPANSDTSQSVRAIFGADATFVSTIAGVNSIQNAASDPLAGIDVLYNTGQGFPGTINIAATGATETGNTVTITTTPANQNHNLQPGATVTIAGVGVADYNGTWVVATVPTTTTFTYTNPTAGLAPSGGGTVLFTQARARMNAFFARGGGYLGTAVSATNFTFLSGAVPALVTSPFTLGSSGAGGGIAKWVNTLGTDSPLTGGYPATDNLFMPSNVTYFSATPTGAVIDGRYHADMVGTAPNGPSPGFVAGLWRNRSALTNNAPVVVHGNTTANSRYLGFAANPFSRQDAEREWTLIGQAALWSNLTDELTSSVDFPANGGAYSNAGYTAGCSTPIDGDMCGTASAGSGAAPLASVQVALQRVSTGLWWNGVAFTSASPAYGAALGTTSWRWSFPASAFPADGDYIVRTKAVDTAGNEQIVQSSTLFTIDNANPTSTITFPANGGIYNAGAWTAGCSTAAVDDICGTAADAGGSGPASVRWSLRRASTGLYWNGSSFSSASQVFITADGAASWSDDFAFSNFAGDGSYTLSARATDRAGNEEAGSTSTFVVDTGGPTSNAVLSGTVNLGWWRNPTVTITATDGAGIQRIEYRLDGGPWITYTAAFVVTGDGSRLLEYRATDNLGNVEAIKSLSFLVDGNAPTTTATLSPPASGGFYRPPTTVTLTANDGLGSGAIVIQYTLDGSGTRSYTGPFQVAASGTHTITYRAVDLTGLIETTKTLTFTSDGIAPLSKATLSPSTITGFYSNPTTVTLSATDNAGGSGVASIEYLLDSGSWTTYSGPFAVSGNGSHTVQFHATDNVGNVEAVKTKSFTIDGAGPNISIAVPVSGGTYTLGSSVTPSYSCTDIASGVASCTGPATVDTSTIGPHSYTVNAADNAGNTSSLTANYNVVVWPFSWSSPPSKVNAGKDLAIKFRLGGNRGLGVLATGSPTSQRVNCSTGATIGSASPTAGSLSFSGGTYTYRWNTRSSWRNTCRKFTLVLDDTTVHTLTIRFK